jgi:hypothetical protein
MENLSLFESNESSEITMDELIDTSRKSLNVVKLDYVGAETLTWQELFAGFDTLYAITYSSGINFVCQLLNQFETAEIIFGCEDVISYSLQEIMAYQSKLIERLRASANKAKQNLIPDAPTVQSIINNTITLKHVDGCEYSKDGRTWQSSNVFSGLLGATEYTFYQRYAETSSTYAGKSSAPLYAKTERGIQSKPSAPTLLGKTHNSVTLKAISGYEYSRDGVNWQTSNVFTDLLPETNYVFYQRKAENESYYASEMSEILVVKTEEAPLYIIGDLDGDGNVNTTDLATMKLFLAGISELDGTGLLAGDLDGDGNVNTTDLASLKLKLAGIE